MLLNEVLEEVVRVPGPSLPMPGFCEGFGSFNAP